MELDHLVLTVRSIKRTVAFYRDVLGIEAVQFAGGRWALKIADQKINLHQAGDEFSPHAAAPTPGSADLCFISQRPIAAWVDDFGDSGIAIELGPIERTGAAGPILSIYLRDPDGNLLEISNPIADRI